MKATTKRWLLRSCSVLVVAWLAFVGYIDWAMHQPPEVFGRVMMRMPMPAYSSFHSKRCGRRHAMDRLNPGDSAPDFAVKTLQTETPVQLASLWAEKPVVLVFGSYT